MRNKKKFLNLCILVLCLVFGHPCQSVHSFGIAAKDNQQKKGTRPLPPKTTRPIKKAPRNAQEREEQSIFATMDELSAIAEGLSKFTQSKESQETAQTKVKKHEAKQKEAEQRLKQQQQNRGRSSWSPSSGSYSPARSNYGSGGYGGGYGGYGGYPGRSYGGGSYGGGGYSSGGYGGSSPWSTNRSSPWSSGSSTFSPSKPGGGSYGFDDADGDDEPKKDKSGKNQPTGGGPAAPSGRKGAEDSYSKLIKNTKNAANLIEKALTGVEQKADPETAIKLLNKKKFGSLASRLPSAFTEITKADTDLQDDEKQKLEIQNSNALKKEQDRLNLAIHKLIPHALLAKTLESDEVSPLTFIASEQANAGKILELYEISSVIKDEDVIKRGEQLMQHYLKDVPTNRSELMKAKGLAGQSKADAQTKLDAYFTSVKTRLQSIANKLPIYPKEIALKIADKIKEIDADLKTVAAL